MTIGLVMIVKDEAAILPRLAESLKGQIDYWTMVDTGSTDDTERVARAAFADVEGQFLHDEWRGFGPSRTVALRAAEAHSDWMLVLDADDTFHGKIDEAQWLPGTDCIEARIQSGDLVWWLPKLLRSNRGWESRGRAHEYYNSPIASPAIRTDSFWIEHHGDGSGRAGKFHRDVALLLTDWEEDPTDSRTAFYLARSYDDAGDWPQAIDWYRTRLRLGGWDEETFYARYRLGACLVNLGATQEGCGHLWEAWGLRTDRAEPLVTLAEHYRLSQQWALAYHVIDLAYSHCLAQPGNRLPRHTGLFVDVNAAAWRAAYEQSISAWYTGHKQRGKMLSEWLSSVILPEPYAASARANAAFYE
jgi:glycosyltransferase involved in cell wall biosynthesis